VSVQNCETYPPARRKNKQALENKIAAAMLYGRQTQQKFDLIHIISKMNSKQNVK
jgi:hypothetical protein